MYIKQEYQISPKFWFFDDKLINVFMKYQTNL